MFLFLTYLSYIIQFEINPDHFEVRSQVCRNKTHIFYCKIFSCQCSQKFEMNEIYRSTPTRRSIMIKLDRPRDTTARKRHSTQGMQWLNTFWVTASTQHKEAGATYSQPFLRLSLIKLYGIKFS